MPKTFHRTDRVSAQIRRDLGTLVHAAVREHGLPSVSVSDVEVTRDMAHAKVFVTALMPERSVEAVKGLRELSVELRMALARAMKLRHVPELVQQQERPPGGSLHERRPRSGLQAGDQRYLG